MEIYLLQFVILTDEINLKTPSTCLMPIGLQPGQLKYAVFTTAV